MRVQVGEKCCLSVNDFTVRNVMLKINWTQLVVSNLFLSSEKKERHNGNKTLHQPH